MNIWFSLTGSSHTNLKCAEVTHWLKNMFVFCRCFWFFLGIQIMPFCHRSGIHGSTSCGNLPMCYFKSDIMNTFQCILNVQVAGKSFCLTFDAPIVQMSCYYCCSKERIGTTWMSFESSIGPSHPISEIVTSHHVCRLKKTGTRVKKNCVLLIKRVRVGHSVRFWVWKGLSDCCEVDHEIYQK